MVKQVTIKILTTQTVEGEQEQMRTLAKGTLETTPNAYLLQYCQSNTEDRAPTLLTVDKSVPIVIMEHNGRMVIEQNKTHTAPYKMGPYEMELGVHGKQVLCRLHPTGGNLKLCYDLSVNGTPAGETTVELFIES